MFIKDKFKERRLVSFEIFPPNKNFTVDRLYETIDNLACLNPDFISVTYGASGNKNCNKTVEIASYIKSKYGIEAMPHLTCITSTKKEINGIVNEIIDNKLKNILALRGDLPNDPTIEFPNPLQFEHASDLLEHIKKNNDICVAGACYPEGHIDAKDINEDLKYLKYKVEMGTDFLISQLFFDNNDFFTMLENFDKLNIKVPVSAGIMPVTNAKQIKRIVALSGAKIPKKLERIIDKYGHDKASMFSAGIDYACNQINDISNNCLASMHLYVMNNPSIAKELISNIDIR